MKALPDIAAAAERILAAGRLTETDGLPVGSPVFDAGNANGLIAGDMGEGAVARSEQSLVVQGNVAGSGARPCTVQARGEVVILGDSTAATVAARQIHIRGTARGCRLTAGEAIAVGGHLAACRAVVGGFDERRRHIEATRLRAQHAAQARLLLEQRLRIEERRVGRVIRNTRFSCEGALGQLIRRRADRIEVDLHPFYRLVGGRTGPEVDRALADFLVRGVIGRLVRANRQYLQANPNLHKVFTRVLAEMRQLFLLVRQLDCSTDERDAAAEALRRALSELRQQDPRVWVRGQIQEDLDLQFVLPGVQQAADGAFTVSAATARLAVSAGTGPDSREVTLVDAAGSRGVTYLPDRHLRNLLLRVLGRGVTWEGLEAGAAATGH